jgi:hypothetical protein
VGRKFTDKGNECHTMACTYTKIIFHVEIVEGKDQSLSIGHAQYEEEYGKLGGLILKMCENGGLYGSGRFVFMDSGFSNLKAILQLQRRGVYAFAIIFL